MNDENDEESYRWNRETRLMLINEIKSRPALWSPSHEKYKNRLLTSEMRQEIAKIISQYTGVSFTSKFFNSSFPFFFNFYKILIIF